jgi:hypothetical protein
MTFEQDTRQQQIEELEQFREGEENHQSPKESETVFEHPDHTFQRLSSDEEEISSHESVTVVKPNKLNSLVLPSQTFNDQLMSHHGEDTEEQAAQNQDLKKIEKSSQEEQETTRVQITELNNLQKMQENEQFQKDLDMIIKRLDQASHQPPSTEKEISSYNFQREEHSHKQGTQSQKLDKIEKLIQEEQEKSMFNDPQQIVQNEQLKLISKFFNLQNVEDKEFIISKRAEDTTRSELLPSTITQTHLAKFKAKNSVYTINDIELFVNKWNEIVDNGCNISEEMWIVYNKIQESNGNPLCALKYLTKSDYYLRYYNELNDGIRELSKINRFTPIYAKYLKFMNPEIPNFQPRDIRSNHEIEILDKLYFLISNEKNGSNYLVRNYSGKIDRKWNPGGYQSSAFKRFKVFEELFTEKIILNSLPTNIKYYIVKTLNSKVPGPKIGDTFISEPRGGRIYLVKGPKYVYRLKVDKETIDEVMQYVYLKYLPGNSWTGGTKVGGTRGRFVKYLKQYNLIFLEDLIDSSVDLTVENFNFKIGVCNKSKALKSFVEKVTNVLKWFDENGNLLTINEKFWQFVKNATNESKRSRYKKIISAGMLAKIWQKSLLENVEFLDINYDLKTANLAGFGNISRLPKIFWNENMKDGITRVIAAIMQDKKVRVIINQKTGLNLTENVKLLETGHICGSYSLISKPDLMTYNIRGDRLGKAIELYQIKRMREIGRGSEYISADDYLLDLLKTIDYIDPTLKNTIIPFQVEILKAGNVVSRLGPLEHHTVILSYWGNTSEKARRIGDIVSSMHNIAFTDTRKKNPIERDVLIQESLNRMKEGMNLLNGTTLYEVSRKRLNQIIDSFDLTRGHLFFLRSAFIEVMKSCYSDFVYT